MKTLISQTVLRQVAGRICSIFNPAVFVAALGLAGFCCAVSTAEAHLILYVDNSAGNDVSVIDAVSNKLIGSIYTCTTPHGVVGSPDGTRLYVSSEAEDTVQAVDTATSTILWTAKVGVRPNEISISGDGRYLYVPIRSKDYCDVVDTETHKVIKSIKVGSTPHNSYRSANGKWIYCTSRGLGTAAIIDIATQTVIGQIPFNGEVRPCAFTSDDRYIYGNVTGLRGFVVSDVAARKQLQVVKLPPEEFKVASIHCYTASHGLAVTKDDKQIWSVNGFGGSMDVFSIPDYKYIKSVPVGEAPDWADITPDGKTIYVANTATDDVSALDVAGMKEIVRIPVGKTPKRLAIIDVPSGMDGPGQAGWDKAASRQSSTDVYLRGGGLVSCETSTFKDQFAKNELTVESVPALYKKLGILGVELDSSYVHSWDDASLDAIIQAVHKEKRLLTAVNIDEGNLVSEDTIANQAQLEKDKQILRAARYLGAPVVCIKLGQTGGGDEADASVGVDRAIAALQSLLPMARELGVRMTFENGDGPAKNPDNIIKIIKATDPLYVGLCFNCRNWDNQKAMNAATDKLAPYAFHCHINGAAFDKLGNESKIDYKYTLAALAQASYSNALSIVIDGKLDAVDSAKKMTDLLTRYWVGIGTVARPSPTIAAIASAAK